MGKKGWFLIFWLVWDLFAFLLLLSYTIIFRRKLYIFHFNLIIIWFSYMFKELFPNSVNLILFWAKKGDFWFLYLEFFWYLFVFAFLSYTIIFWRKLYIFHFNLIVIWLYYTINDIFPNPANLTVFRAKKGDFWFFDLEFFWDLFFCCFFILYNNVLKKVAYF